MVGQQFSANRIGTRVVGKNLLILNQYCYNTAKVDIFYFVNSTNEGHV